MKIEEEMMTEMPFQRCPTCGGGTLAEKKVEKIIRGGKHTASLTVTAWVCQDCRERIYSAEVLRRFDEIRGRLEREELQGFQPIGQQFRVA